jgi:uncharacterized protein
MKSLCFLYRNDLMNTPVVSPPAPLVDVDSVTIVPVSRWIWPGILIAGPASVVIACIITAFFVVQHPEALVASDYYKQGKAINAQLSQLSRADALGLSTMTTQATDTTFTIRFPDARTEDSANKQSTSAIESIESVRRIDRIEIILAHPVDANRDIRAFASPNVSGAYEIALPQKLTERRRVIVTDSPARRWRVEVLFVPNNR